MPAPARVVPMLHVPDVPATIAWYQSIGFVLREVHEESGCPIDWALLCFGVSEIMLSAGGRPPLYPRTDVDLYVQVDNLDDRFAAVASKVEVVEGLHETHYGMREFIIKDLNGFWITFGQLIQNG